MKKLINYMLITIMIIGSIIYATKSVINNDYSRIHTYILLIPLLLIPTVLKKLKINLNDDIETLYIIFIFIADFLGCIVNLYKEFYWFDTFVHFLSGIFFSIIFTSFLYQYNIKINKKIMIYLYILCFTMLTASIWEFFEFGIDKITNSNLQHSVETGVKDTMTDMFAAFLGSITFISTYNLKKDN